MTDIYLAKHQQQKTLYKGKLIGCTETSFAMFVDAVTLGGVKVTEKSVRAMSSEPIPSPESPGLNIQQMVAVADKLGIEFKDKTNENASQLYAYLDQGRRLVVQVWLSVLGGGNIGHALEIEARRTRQTDINGPINGYAMLVNDPLKTVREWISQDTVLHAMAVFAAKTNSGLRFGTGKIVPLPVPNTVWGSDVPADIVALDPPSGSVATWIRRTGHNPGSLIGMADLKEALRRIGHDWGAVVNVSDVLVLRDHRA